VPIGRITLADIYKSEIEIINVERLEEGRDSARNHS
jgi:hypothetical protein